MFKTKKVAIILVLILTLVTLSGCQSIVRRTRYHDDAFYEVFDYVLNNHYSQPDEADLWKGAINGLLQSLDDPFTNYFDAEAYESFREGQSESFVGIGVSVETVSGRVVIRSVFPESPASKAGLLSGDIITHVDGVDYRGRSHLEIAANIRGEVGTDVTIGVQRPNVEETIFVTMTRAEIDNPSVTAELFNDAIGYIEVHTFGDETADRFEDYVNAFEADSMEGLIIDVRDNGGGSLTTLIDMLNVFLSSDTSNAPMFSLETTNNKEVVVHHEYPENSQERKPYPIIILVNENSASASEVFASAMHEYGGYPVYGMTTYGKGTMQSSIPMRSKAGDRLHLTIGIWLTSDGNWIDQHGEQAGFEPSVIIEQNPYLRIPGLLLQEDEVYTYDTVDNNIKTAQQMLNAIGYTLREDGYFDSATEDQLINFQLQHGLTRNGQLNSATAQMLSDVIYDYRNNIENDTQFQAAFDALLEAIND